jgi:hypothetical protein
MLSILVYQGQNPINKKLMHNLTILETKYENSLIVHSFNNKLQLEQLLIQIKVISVLFFNELSSSEQINEICRIAKDYSSIGNTLYVFPVIYSNSLLKMLHRIGTVTFVEDNIGIKQVENILLYWEKNYIQNLYFIYRNNRRMILALYADILYFEAEKRHIHVYTIHGKEMFSGKMNEIDERISHDTCVFVRTHQSFLVNACKIKSINSHTITMINDTIIPISYNRYEEVSQKMDVVITTFRIFA